MSLVLLESATGAPAWVAGLVVLVAMVGVLMFIRNWGKGNPHAK